MLINIIPSYYNHRGKKISIEAPETTQGLDLKAQLLIG